jgi:hypothetical protein
VQTGRSAQERGRRVSSTIGAMVLGLAASACTRPASPLADPSTKLPWFAARIGEPCDTDIEWGGGDEHCTAGRISYVTRWGPGVHNLITGVVPSQGCCSYGVPCRQSWEPPAQSPTGALPPTLLATRTAARVGLDTDEQRIYVDGAYLWVVGVSEVSVSCRRGSILIADRRLLADADRTFVREVLDLEDPVDLDDDEALKRAVEALPSLPPGTNGYLETSDP